MAINTLEALAPPAGSGLRRLLAAAEGLLAATGNTVALGPACRLAR